VSRNKTVGQLTASVRFRGDYEDVSGDYDDAYIGSALMLDFLDAAHSEVYDIMVEVEPDRYLTEYTFTTSADQETYPLPADFYRSRAVDIASSSGSTDWYSMDRYESSERNAYGYQITAHAYRIEDGVIRVKSTPSGQMAIRLSYIPTATSLSSSAQTVDTVNGYDALTVLLALRSCKVRSGESVKEIDGEISRQTMRVREMARGLDRGKPRRLGDPGRRNGSW